MLSIRPEQITPLREVAEREALARTADEVYRAVWEVHGGQLSGYPRETALTLITEVIKACRGYGIGDFDDLCIWSYLRLETKEEFYRSSAFKYFLDDPLIHPKSKARNIVIAMQLASDGSR